VLKFIVPSALTIDEQHTEVRRLHKATIFTELVSRDRNIEMRFYYSFRSERKNYAIDHYGE